MDKSMKDISATLWIIIIPFRNCYAQSLRMLTRLYLSRKNDNLLDRVKVVVMDDASSEEERENLKSVADSLAFEINTPFPNERKGSGAMRNAGAKYAHDIGADFVSFFDADDDIDPKAIKIIYEYMKNGNCDYLQWGFRVHAQDNSKSHNWLSRFNSPDLFIHAPPAPWLHAIRPWMFVFFPEYLLTDDVVWWYKQADVISRCAHAKKCIEKPLYHYYRYQGGCAKASDFFDKNPTTLEVVARENICAKNGLNDRFISDCFRNMAELYDARNQVENPEIKKLLINRLSTDFSLAVQGKFGW